LAALAFLIGFATAKLLGTFALSWRAVVRRQALDDNA
jgi:hypothetical protein